MKFDVSLLQRSTDKFVVYARELSSRGTSFLIVLLGVILQASHTTLLMYNVSAFENAFIKFIVSLGIGLFVSMSLAVFTLKHDGKNQKIAQLINIFFYFEIFTNLFYYFESILLSKGLDNLELKNWIFFFAALPFAYIMPYAIKQFAGVIAADKSVDFGLIDVMPKEEQEDAITDEELHARIRAAFDVYDADGEVISNSFDDAQTYIANASSIEQKLEYIESTTQKINTIYDRLCTQALNESEVMTTIKDEVQLLAKNIEQSVLQFVDLQKHQQEILNDGSIRSMIVEEIAKVSSDMHTQIHEPVSTEAIEAIVNKRVSESQNDVTSKVIETLKNDFAALGKTLDDRYVRKSASIIVREENT